ncbi:unnamed protein product [Spirodela intermedia]|uniref:Uncharacterized protein n=1 Tax=Spirodela intermedia TaxID=51605 RepID=A0ABN7EBN9_SPIIN|nr:unnamed protein product [Spirodela intermedia]
MWLQHENFQSFVRNHWYGQISDSPMENLSYRLRNLKLHLKWWNRHIYGMSIPKLMHCKKSFWALGLHIIPTQTWTTIRSVRWTPPKVGQWKLNVDGASQGNYGPSGGGGILRDSTGCIFFAFSNFYNI